MENNAIWLRSSEAAEYLRMGSSTLAKLRCYGGGPRFHKAGSRVVLYSLSDLDRWLTAQDTMKAGKVGLLGKLTP